MRESERVVVSGIVGLMLVLWLGFLVHRSSGFAGSLTGGMLAVSGAALMLVPLAYSAVKRVRALRVVVTRRSSMRTLLGVHIYAGLAGAILALLHTGHKFESTLGIVLTATMLIVVLSGYVGRYLLGFIAEGTRAKQAQLATLWAQYDRLAGAATNEGVASDAASRAVPLIESMADLEHAIRGEERIRSFFALWLKWHVLVSSGFYVLLGLHVWAALEFGLRWFR